MRTPFTSGILLKEPLPKGANFIRGKTLWEIGLHESLSEHTAHDICAALAAREAEIPSEEKSAGSALAMPRESDSTPMDVPLHPGAERWLRQHG